MADPILPLAELVARTRYEDLPPRAIEAAKTFILDTLGVGAGGASAPRVRELVETAAGWGAGEESTVAALDSLADVRDLTALVRGRS